jgi:hypothetical protein
MPQPGSLFRTCSNPAIACREFEGVEQRHRAIEIAGDRGAARRFEMNFAESLRRREDCTDTGTGEAMTAVPTVRTARGASLAAQLTTCAGDFAVQLQTSSLLWSGFCSSVTHVELHDSTEA